MTTLADFDAAALELLTYFGTTMTYRKVTAGAYNPATGAVATTPSSISVLAAVVDLTLQSNGLSVKYGTEVKSGDKEAYLVPPIKNGGSALVIDTVNDKFVTPDGTVYSIVTFKEVNPSGSDPVLYSLYLRR